MGEPKEFIPSGLIEEDTPSEPEMDSTDESGELPEWLKDPAYEVLKNENGEIPAYLRRFKSPVEAVKAAYEAKKTLSKKLVDLPTEESPEEAWDSVYTKLGRIDPETAKLEIDIDGKSVDVSESINPQFKELIVRAAHAMGANQRGLKKALQLIYEFETQKLPEVHQQMLNAEWKGDFKKNLSIINREFKNIPEPLRNEIIQNFGPMNTTISKLLLYFAKKTGNDQSLDKRNMESFMTDIDEEINKIYKENLHYKPEGQKRLSELFLQKIRQNRR